MSGHFQFWPFALWAQTVAYFKRGRTRVVRIAAAPAAVVVLLYIFGVAVTKSAWGPLADRM